MKQTEAAAGERTPLLADASSVEDQSSRAPASVSGAVFNICTTMVGAGIMSIPATIKVLGIIPGFVVIVMIALLVEITVEFLLRYTQSGKSTTYAGLVAESFGSWGSIAVQICVMITNLGCLIIYLIIIGKPLYFVGVVLNFVFFYVFLFWVFGISINKWKIHSIKSLGDVLCGNQTGGTLHLGILQEWFGIQWWNSRAYVILFVVVFVMLPLVLLPHMS